MSFANIKAKNQGFTIVELLIVVVVIAILAAITIVSYNGITARANQSSAKATASSLAKKAELFNTDDQSPTAGYPTTSNPLSTDSTKSYYIASANFGTSAPTTSNGKTYVQYLACGVAASGTTAPTTQATVATATGGLIHWYDFVNGRVTTTSTDPASITVGVTSGTSGGKTIGCPTS
jgi:prepilin-type N-terminal cleavage/methylation domain-containing protein